jgi:hypothetical protein
MRSIKNRLLKIGRKNKIKTAISSASTHARRTKKEDVPIMTHPLG